MNLKDYIVEDAEEITENGMSYLLVTGHLHKGRGHRCPSCSRKLSVYDRQPLKTWSCMDRCMDMGGKTVYIQASRARIDCPEHGIQVEAVPWARPDSGFTRSFEDTAFVSSKQMPIHVGVNQMRISPSNLEQIIQRLSQEVFPLESL